jgi:hypothetical protein
MAQLQTMRSKQEFEAALNELAANELAATLVNEVSADDGQWTIKGFVDTFRQVYTISSDTKVVSKILEIHLFPKILAFADQHGFAMVLAEHQNYYPDISFVSKADESSKFAVDFKTTYRNGNRPWLCNGFTLGSHGQYFENRTSTKNIQFPYGSYWAHYCLGIIYNRSANAASEKSGPRSLDDLHSIASVISNFRFFIAEKWKIAGDKPGSGNTANIGSIQRIEDILSGNGMFANLGEDWFDDYCWMNFGKITVKTDSGDTKRVTTLEDFVKYRGGDASLIVPRNNQQ